MIDVELVHGGFTKYHLNREGRQPWPFRPILHHFRTPDIGDPHDHPWDFTTYIVQGSYIEEVYTLTPHGGYRVELHRRQAGSSHNVPAEYIHRIIDLPDGECWTFCIYGPTRRESLFYRFEPDSIQTRPWHQPHW